MDRPHGDWPSGLFYLSLALLVGHELDAVTHQEWRLLPVLGALAEDTARWLFVLLHVPLLAVVFWLVGHDTPPMRCRARAVFDGFLIVHAGAHFVMSSHPLYTFGGSLEGILIYGAAVGGAAHLVAVRSMR